MEAKNFSLNVLKETKDRLDKFLSENMEEVSRSKAAKWIEKGCVTVNGKIANKKYVPKLNDAIAVSYEEKQTQTVAENIPLSIVYEDEDLLVVNKPQGMVVHPAAGNDSGTLVNALLYHCGEHLSTVNEDETRPGILHRIDKETSGLLLVAKTNAAHEKLAVQIKEHSLGRYYMALVHGGFSEDDFTINRPIARHPRDRKKMAIVEGGREAVTHFHVVERFGAYSLVRCRLETGRTHQIRVHMSAMGHPVVGDALYGVKKEEYSSLKGQLLHACLLGFIHPKTGEYMEFTAPLPPYFRRVLTSLRQKKK